MRLWLSVFRTFKKQKIYILTSIGSLTVGLTCCILIGLYVRSELRFESHHLNRERIYRVIREWEKWIFADRDSRIWRGKRANQDTRRD